MEWGPQKYILKQSTHSPLYGDHNYIKLILSLEDLSVKPSPQWSSSPYCKLNTSILKDEDFLENFLVMYRKLQEKIQNYSDIADWWDHCAKP